MVSVKLLLERGVVDDVGTRYESRTNTRVVMGQNRFTAVSGLYRSSLLSAPLFVFRHTVPGTGSTYGIRLSLATGTLPSS